jgi:hypothetical protein
MQKAVLMWMVEVGKFVIGRTATHSHSLTLMAQLYDSFEILRRTASQTG